MSHRRAAVRTRARLHRAAWALLAWPGVVAAALDFHPYAASQYEYNSNVFSLSSRAQAIAHDGTAARADTDWRSVAGADTALAWGQDRLSATAEGRRQIYDRFSSLDHDEYLLAGAFDWKAFGNSDGTLSARQERRMASFADRISTQLALERDRTATATYNLNLAPQWRIETDAGMHRLDSPLPGFPLFSLNEDSGDVALKYLGLGPLVAGAKGTYINGRFRGVPDSPGYVQLTGVLTFTYTVSGLSDFDGNAGYTRFTSHGGGAEAGTVEGVSGGLGWTRHLSAKTEADARVFRRIDSYVAGADVVIDDGADAGFHWQANTEISLAANYEWAYSAYRALAAGQASGSDRRDHYQASSLALSYLPRPWLTLRVFGNYYDRGSNISVDSFNQALAGLELRLRLP